MLSTRPLWLVVAVVLADVAAAQGPASYTIDAPASDVHWRIYKAGAFARLGHNHVIAATALSGTVTLPADPSRASFELAIPVDALVVDDPGLRSRYGEDFSSVPSADEIAGTKRNMLSEKVLDGANHATLRVHGKVASGKLAEAKLAITVEMLGRSVELVVPGSIALHGDTLVASGEFSLTHDDLGMQPFSVMLGALAVAQPLDFFYRIRAVKAHH